MAYIATNVTVAVQSTVGTALTVTGVTLANPGVATSTGHGLANGDIVYFTVTAGMVELNGQAVRVANVATDTFELESLDTTDYTAWSTGTATEVTAFETLGSAQSISMPDPTPEKIDITTLIDSSKQYVFGLPDAPDGSISGLYDPLSTAVGLIKTATKSNAAMVFKITWSGGQTTVFNAYVSGGSGFEASQNAAATASISFTPIRDVLVYDT